MCIDAVSSQQVSLSEFRSLFRSDFFQYPSPPCLKQKPLDIIHTHTHSHTQRPQGLPYKSSPLNKGFTPREAEELCLDLIDLVYPFRRLMQHVEFESKTVAFDIYIIYIKRTKRDIYIYIIIYR